MSEVLKTLVAQNKWAAFIWGAPGIGKSSVVRQVAASLGKPVLDIRASLLDPTDLRGIPMVVDGKAVWCPPTFLPRKEDKPGILFLDEINAAPPLVQAGLYQLVLDRKVGEYELPEGWQILAAGNRREDKAVTFRMSSALSNRFIHLTFDIDADDWHNWAVRSGIDPTVIAFLALKPSLLMHRDASSEVFASPRSWEMLSDTIKSFGGVKQAVDIVAGIIGEGPAVEFLAFAKNQSVAADIKRLLADPAGAPMPTGLDKVWLVVTHLISGVKKPSVRAALPVILNRLPPDFGMVLVRDTLLVWRGLEKTDGFREFIRNHGDLVL